jgi:hypothetical protein
MVGRLDEGVDLPDLVRRQAQAEGWHLRSLAAVGHGLQKAWAVLGEEAVFRSAKVPTRRHGAGLPKRLRKRFDMLA